METKLFVVLAISVKEEKEHGWLKVAVPDDFKANWSDMGMFVDKTIAHVFTEPGIYKCQFETKISFGKMPQYTVQSAEPMFLFSEI